MRDAIASVGASAVASVGASAVARYDRRMDTRYDVVIVGGGVTGCSTALFLAREPGFDGSVLVVERDPTYENAPSAKATGGFRQQFSTPENVRIGLFGVEFLKHLDVCLSIDGETPDVGFRENGYLLVATEPMLPTMLDNNAVQRELGADVHFRSPHELRTRFAWLRTSDIAGGFLSDSGEGYVDPYSLLQAYRRKARSLGVEFVHDEVVSVRRDGARVTGVTLARAGGVACGVVVNAAGASGAPEICGSLGVELPIESRKRCTYVFECREPIGQTPLTITETGVGFRSEGSGFIVNLSPPAERDPATKDTEIDYELFDELVWPALALRVPAFEAIKLTGAWCCHYDYNTLDENLIIGRTPMYENFYLAAGFSGHGLQQSPAVGRALCELIAFGEFRTIDLTRFGYQRVLDGVAIRETNCY